MVTEIILWLFLSETKSFLLWALSLFHNGWTWKFGLLTYSDSWGVSLQITSTSDPVFDRAVMHMYLKKFAFATYCSLTRQFEIKSYWGGAVQVQDSGNKQLIIFLYVRLKFKEISITIKHCQNSWDILNSIRNILGFMSSEQCP